MKGDLRFYPLPGVIVDHCGDASGQRTGIRFKENTSWRWIVHTSKRLCPKLHRDRDAAVRALAKEKILELRQEAGRLYDESLRLERVLVPPTVDEPYPFGDDTERDR